MRSAISRDLLLTLLAEGRERRSRFRIPRDGVIKELFGKISTITGMRRSGKTSRMFQLIDEKIQGGIPDNRILYINFEDERLEKTAATITALVDAFYLLYPDNYDHTSYLFFDEIQEVKEWEVAVRRLLDTGRCAIYLTGSSSRMLSKEIATSLRGRALNTEIWPFSFREFLRARKAEQILSDGVPSLKDKAVRFNYLREYLQVGGLPEIVLAPTHFHQDILRSYKDTVIYRDLIDRHALTNTTLLNFILDWLISNSGSRCSVTKMFNIAKSQGVSVSRETMHQYLALIEDTYFGFQSKLFTPSVTKRLSGNTKFYCIDPAFTNYLTISPSEKLGAMFESVMYIELKRRGLDVSYYLTDDGLEVDFVCQRSGDKPALMQVCWDIEKIETFERESKALEQATSETGLKGNLITPERFFELVSSGH